MQEDFYWQAVMSRNSQADGTFVYAVRSTGIYCNPSCPSRRPKREHVLFFPLPADAEQAGFRACRRCQPQLTPPGEAQVAMVQQVCSYIESHLEEPVTLATLGSLVNMSPFHLQRIFKQSMGISPHQYAEACRLKKLKTRLREGETVTSALIEAGYSSTSRLYERSQAHLGMTPNRYRSGGQNMLIRYTLVTSPLGRLLVAATEKGICFVSLGDSDELLEEALFQEYPAAEIVCDGQQLADWVTALLHHLEGEQPHLSLPLDVQATAFQWRVWRELQAIPYGETRSYGEIAQALGDKKKARAVAQACATNPVALAVPCHRVIRENGAPGGYRWGSERKERLLAQEQAVYIAHSGSSEERPLLPEQGVLSGR
ncbi:MAG TPA: bifunctional DNA-binding transcriptional regulator/O6-methylguanine-DNA methyltransferase Ada [Ktedonobacteraceae bacterium]|jgi:AraC family transcriptional regulator of adaptative response/methylated-DNA-[protein]-cysteine methyltransferase|nr:bifunctional DNA-binding transcriptional regulator/O6-methylguanine-DNA methyltransferase Ada [Ktedonobacteraceae bacterium]